ncbi:MULTISPECIES: fimbrial protein [unclassified Enterobacter]|uniref:F4 family fimbrial subunit n=1 Tax=unclassified Enterobacter TaxID=2608935 RepID=UPI000EF9F669|nr:MULTISPECIES: fimbrial protein [unclassified Enterobacter]RMA79671.1 fimbrial protein [Enterobacter sp. WP_7_1]RMA87505.1 fimbrial protein [Enterobacter sp. WP_7_2]
MKKTLIAMAVAASAAVSGSVMAWTQNGTGGSVDLSGTLTPVEKVTPWEVKIGQAVTNLDALVQKGQSSIDLLVKEAIPVLGIRTQEAKAFSGKPGISPQIDFRGTVNLNGFSGGLSTLTLEVKDNNDQKIGTLSVPFAVGSAGSVAKNGVPQDQWRLIAPTAGNTFYGGLPTNESGVPTSAWGMAATVFEEAAMHYQTQGVTYWGAVRGLSTEDPSLTYSAYYASGIQAGAKAKINLDAPATGDAAIAWKASLPVTVHYQ